MKPYEELTYLGRIRRMHRLAKKVTEAYGLGEPQIKFLKQAGNTLFRVYESNPTHKDRMDVYAAGQYLLRIHQPGYQTNEGIELELTWLQAMCKDASLPVPEPITTLDGKLLTQVSFPGITGERTCTLLRWVNGRLITKNPKPKHYQAHGQLLAKLHNHAQHWRMPTNLQKRKYDWEGLFGETADVGIPTIEAWSLLPKEYSQPFEKVTNKVRQVMDSWGKSPDVYGLIHADLGMDSNLLFLGGQARAIDFDDSGFGYYLYDLSLALEHIREEESLPEFREALVNGYKQFRALPDDPEKYLDLFLSAFCVYLSLWCAGMTKNYPKYRDELMERMERAYKLIGLINLDV